MKSERFTHEFKDEAEKQIVERGYSVAEISARLGLWDSQITENYE
jgi:transposase